MLYSSARVLLLGLLLCAASSFAASDPESVRLLHRIYHPSRPSEPFTDRAALLLHRSGSSPSHHGAIRAASLVPHDTLQNTVASLEQVYQSVIDDLGAHEGMTPTMASHDILYQLAMEHPGDTHHSQWHVSSVKAVSRRRPFGHISCYGRGEGASSPVSVVRSGVSCNYLA